MTYISSCLRYIISLEFITLLTILAIAGCAGYFSIVGLMLILSGAPIAVAFMAGSLEIGKLIITSIVFNYWRKLPILLTTYAVIAVIGLMAITSGGIYGFLSAAYQKGQAPLVHTEQRITLIEEELARKIERTKQMDDIISKINPDYITKRLEEKKQQAVERDELRIRINQLEQEKLQLYSQKLETEVHIGPIVKIAQAFDVSEDRAAHILIMMFVFVFDPLAVALTLCLNVIIRIKKDKITNTTSTQIINTDNLSVLLEDKINHISDEISTITKQINGLQQAITEIEQSDLSLGVVDSTPITQLNNDITKLIEANETIDNKLTNLHQQNELNNHNYTEVQSKLTDLYNLYKTNNDYLEKISTTHHSIPEVSSISNDINFIQQDLIPTDFKTQIKNKIWFPEKS